MEEDGYTLDVLKNALTNSCIYTFKYYPVTKSIEVPSEVCKVYKCKQHYDDMPYSFAQDYVNKNDTELFYEMYYKINNGEKFASCIFHNKDYRYKNYVTLTTIKWDDNNNPIEVIGVIQNYSINIPHETVLNTIKELFRVIYIVDIKKKTFLKYYEQTSSTVSRKGQINDIVNYAKEIISPKYIEEFYKFIDTSDLDKRLETKNYLEHVYRKVDNTWEKCFFININNEPLEETNKVLLIAIDINAEKNKELEVRRMEYEAEHDQLTGLYNRNAYIRISNELKKLKRPVGVAVIDVDNFKSINDTFGHDIGDKVLAKVGKVLKNSFVATTYVFRMGGDEFYIIIDNFEEYNVNYMSGKLKKIYSGIHDFDEAEVNISLSIGATHSKDGYNDELYRLADDAMYYSKKTNNGGCVAIDKNHQIIFEWNNKVNNNGFLCGKDTTQWKIILSKDNKFNRMYLDNSLKKHLGLSLKETSKEIYDYWYTRINDDDKNKVKKAINLMLDGNNVDVNYRWNTEDNEEIYLRCYGTLSGESEDSKSISGYVQDLTKTIIIK